MEAQSCPKCEFAVEPGRTECLRCGIVFARYRGGGDVFDARRLPSAGVSARPYEGDEVLASRGSRFGAQLVNLISMAPFLLAIAVPAGLLKGRVKPEVLLGGGLAILLGLAGLLALAIYNLYLLHRYGQSLGKRVCNIKIVRTDGEPASLGRLILLRWLVPGALGNVPTYGPFFSLLNVLLIFTADRRCFHDYLADTKVVVAPPS